MLKMSKVFDILERGKPCRFNRERSPFMPTQAMMFLTGMLVVFGVLDVILLKSLLVPGDERNQIIVWKAASFTLLGVSGSLILEVLENFFRSQPMSINPLIQLEVIATLYFFSLMYYRKKHGG